MFSEVAEIVLVATWLGQFQQLLKTRAILILNFTRPHAINYTNIILEIFELIFKKEEGCISPMILTKALQTVYTWEQLLNKIAFFLFLCCSSLVSRRHWLNALKDLLRMAMFFCIASMALGSVCNLREDLRDQHKQCVLNDSNNVAFCLAL